MARAVRAATGVQNAAVEDRVMGRQEPHAAQPAMQLRPKPGEVRSVPHHLPVDAVKVREDELTARRTDQAAYAVDDPAVLDPDQSDGAGAIPAIVRRFKVDRGKTSCPLAMAYRPTAPAPRFRFRSLPAPRCAADGWSAGGWCAAQVGENLRSQAVLVLQLALAGAAFLVRRIGAVRHHARFAEIDLFDAEPGAGLVEVDQNAGALGGDGPQRIADQPGALALNAAEDVAIRRSGRACAPARTPSRPHRRGPAPGGTRGPYRWCKRRYGTRRIRFPRSLRPRGGRNARSSCGSGSSRPRRPSSGRGVAELLQLGDARHGAVLVHDFAITPAGERPARRARSTEASVWPARTRTPPSRRGGGRRGRGGPGRRAGRGGRWPSGWCACGRRRRCPRDAIVGVDGLAKGGAEVRGIQRAHQRQVQVVAALRG